jgi:hypothetical protein
VDEEALAEDEEPLSVILERRVSYFADEDGIYGLLKHLGENPWGEAFNVIRDGFNKTIPRKPFCMWKNLDAYFKHLVGGRMNFDPAKRIAAHEALADRWFEDV